MKNYHTIEVKYLGATNTKGSRVKMTSERFGQSVTIPYDYALNTIEEMAEEWLTNNGHKVIGQGDTCLIVEAVDHRFKPLKD